jgi:hypothetical protein
VADNNEPTLRNALDAVNRSRRWAIVGITSLFVVIAIALAVLSMMVVIPATQQGIDIAVPSTQQGIGGDPRPGEPIGAGNRLITMKVLWVVLAAQLFFVACGAIAVILHVSRMTRAVLRAIESSRT